MVRPRPRRAGFTLVEALMVVAIVGVVFGLAPTLLIQMTRFFRQNRARVEIQRDARNALDLINRNLRQAKASTVVVDAAASQPPYSRIAFTKAQGSSLTFYQQGKTLYMVSGGTKAISSNLRYLAFTYPRSDDDNIISVSITMETGTFETKTKALQLSVEKVRVMND
jgi:prepilin-type N-terminal cleavage/methylation domain-containing protein